MNAISVEQAMQAGVQHQQSGRLAEAERIYRLIIAQQPLYGQAHYRLGTLYLQAGKFDAAISALRQATILQPTFGEAFGDLAIALQKKGEISEATENDFNEAMNAFGMTVRLLPGSAPAWMNLGAALMRIGEHAEALAALRKSVQLDPGRTGARSLLIYASHFHAESDARSLLAEARGYAALVEGAGAQSAPFGNDRSPDRRLKVGYVSPHFRGHPVARFLFPLLENHDAREVEVFCYSGVTAADDTTRRFKRLPLQYIEVAGLSDEQLAERIRADGIDILVDLTLHMMGNRLAVFARRAAPVQVSWLGYAGTTGLAAMDYRLTDAVLDPPGQSDAFYSEKSVRLPHGYWCYEPYVRDVEVNALPAASASVVTFGCCNGFIKTTARSIDLFARVLAANDGSRLVLHCPPGEHRKRVLERFGRAGAAAERIEFVGNKSIRDYLLGYQRIDICLDPIPYGGGTTTCDATWMGVPTVTMRGRTAVGRGSASILTTVGLADWIAEDEQQYVSIATKMAADLPALANLRVDLRGKMEQSPLMDGKLFAADMEAAMRRMWRDWVAGFPVQS